ncbi:D-aminoacyl-tRNA deacylase 1-like [Budorcas taxicolor]|uniref:D-aminoacyl-tRNA deacylase 1-like n=1 Tax=Budorcas taxicolor TaxID=37181 RepID=UPI002283A804|nr:D-aminoacyl-tRNA deacylase 1-like [Budorcas taxicolor]
MKAVVPHVTQASITVGGEQIGAIRWVIGMLLGISLEDAQKKLEHVGWKILNLHVFKDESGKHWSKSVMDKQYDVLCQSFLQRVLKGNEPDFHLPMPAGQAEAFYKGFLEPLCKVARPELIKNGKFSAYLQVHIQNDGPVAVEPESPAPGAVASDSEHLSKLEKQQQKTEKARAKRPSESSKKRSAPHKEDHKASSGA